MSASPLPVVLDFKASHLKTSSLPWVFCSFTVETLYPRFQLVLTLKLMFSVLPGDCHIQVLFIFIPKYTISNTSVFFINSTIINQVVQD